MLSGKLSKGESANYCDRLGPGTKVFGTRQGIPLAIDTLDRDESICHIFEPGAIETGNSKMNRQEPGRPTSAPRKVVRSRSPTFSHSHRRSSSQLRSVARKKHSLRNKNPASTLAHLFDRSVTRSPPHQEHQHRQQNQTFKHQDVQADHLLNLPYVLLSTQLHTSRPLHTPLQPVQPHHSPPHPMTLPSLSLSSSQLTPNPNLKLTPPSLHSKTNLVGLRQPRPGGDG